MSAKKARPPVYQTGDRIGTTDMITHGQNNSFSLKSQAEVRHG